MKKPLLIIGLLATLIACQQVENHLLVPSAPQENDSSSSSDSSMPMPPVPETPEKDGGITKRPPIDTHVQSEGTQGHIGNVTPPPCNLLHLENLGITLSSSAETCAAITTRPTWSSQAVASATFTRSSGKQYTMLIYEKDPGETLQNWMANSEVGDSYISERTVKTGNNFIGYIYETNDLGALPAVHITVFGSNFVYYFRSEENETVVPADFVNFVSEIEMH